VIDYLPDILSPPSAPMNATIRKFYSLPGVWQLFTVPVMTASFTMTELKKSAFRSYSALAVYSLFWLICVVELAALITWYTIRYSGYAAPFEVAAGATFGASAFVLLTWSCVYAWRHKPAFREFLLKTGFTPARVDLTAANS
jgi:hypothetical protein